MTARMGEAVDLLVDERRVTMEKPASEMKVFSHVAVYASPEAGFGKSLSNSVEGVSPSTRGRRDKFEANLSCFSSLPRLGC